MKLRNFVTNIMITKNFLETRYQYNDHEGWGGNLVTNIMITNFFREIRYQDNDHEGFPRNVVIISWACKNFMNSDQFVIRVAQTPCGGRFVAYKAYCNYITWTHVYLDLKLIHKNICKPLASSIKPTTAHIQYQYPIAHGRFIIFTRICAYIYGAFGTLTWNY